MTEMDDELRPEYDLRMLLKDGVRGKYVERYVVGAPGQRRGPAIEDRSDLALRWLWGAIAWQIISLFRLDRMRF